MRALLVVGLVLMGCGPFTPNVVGRTCDAGVKEQSCSSATTYAACDGNIWREYSCGEACVEGGTCDLSASKAGTACPVAWKGVQVCKAARFAITCIDGGWRPDTCAECPAGSEAYCFACSCT